MTGRRHLVTFYYYHDKPRPNDMAVYPVLALLIPLFLSVLVDTSVFVADYELWGY